MSKGSVEREHVAYRRGMVLGLTMAEIILLLLFSLLLALAALLWTKQEEFREKEIELSKLSKIVEAISEYDLKQMAKEMVVLNDAQDAIDSILERIEGDGSAPEKIEALVEKVSRLEEREKVIENIGLPSDTQKFKQELDKLVEEAKKSAQLEEENKNLDQEREQLSKQLANQQRMIDRSGNGTEKPACWADKETGKPKYIYNIGLTSRGLIIGKREYPLWAKAKTLPLNDEMIGQEFLPRDFVKVVSPIFQWSIKNECRFFVRAFDLTEATEKKIYKRHMRSLESAFYKYEVRDEKWSSN
jgi:hypothetical protein